MVYTPKISEDSVLRATGKSWQEWFAILDKGGAKKMKHIDIARWLGETHLQKKDVSPDANNMWWVQSITVEYERARGLRKVNQNKDGFTFSVQKTVECSVTQLQEKWQDIIKTSKVSQKKLEPIPSKTKYIMLRYRAKVGEIMVVFEKTNEKKSRIIIDVCKLPNAKVKEKERAFWKEVVEKI